MYHLLCKIARQRAPKRETFLEYLVPNKRCQLNRSMHTIQYIDSTMLPREHHPFGCKGSKPNQSSVPPDLTLAGDFRFCFQWQGGFELSVASTH
jgi:hypothetical protein